MLFLRSLLFYIGISLAILVFTPLGLLLLVLPFRQRYRVMTQWGRFAIWWLEKTCQLNYQVQGLENIPTTPAIVLSKHQSAWETIVFQTLFPMQVWLVKRELLQVPFFGWALAVLQPIAIDRKNLRKSMQKIVEQGKQRLAEGKWIVIFPEGTRVNPGEKKRYGVGGAMLAAESGYPVVPVALNSGKFWPPKGFVKRPGTIKVVIGPVIESTGKSYKEINALTEKWIEEMVVKIQE
jgi:1-acyl-sn-glycerol-3-phosphate acyltransferase